MFWRFGGYANVSTIDTILERDNFELEELLDESDLVQELKQHNARLVEYLRDPQVLEKLLKYVVAPKLEPVASPDDEEEDEDRDEKARNAFRASTASESSSKADDTNQEDREKKRNRYALISTEILSSDAWSIYDALMESKSLLRDFWQFLKRDAPLDPLQASYFTKVNESLFDKKTEEMLDLLKSMEGAVQDILRHVECPMIMDLLLKIISLERTESGQGIVEWLYTQNVMSSLVSFLSPEHTWATQTSAADFIKAIITVSANASQNEQTCIGPNELTRQLVSRPCVEQLIKYMLGGGNPLTCGVGIVIEVIRKNNSDYDPEGVDINAPPSSRDPIYLGTLLRLFAEHVPDFMNLILNAPAQNQHLSSTFGGKIEPLGFDRFKTCELMAELLHCSNMMLLNEHGAEELIAARDAQRHRLRAEGKLLPVSNRAAAPAEDLSTRTSEPSAPEQGRKLEVTNATVEDDGFEEVSHATDEDSTHGVLELPDAPAQQPSTPLAGKDDEEFVDEPLTSPNPGTHDPEVAHHLPSKEILETQDLGETKTGAPATGSMVEIPQLKSEEKPESAQDPGTREPEQAVQTDSTPLVSGWENAENKIGSAAPAEAEATTCEEIQPRPEDIPAPLFSRESRKTTSDEPSSSVEGPSGTSLAASAERDPEPVQEKTEDTSAPQPTQPAGDTSVAAGDNTAEAAPSAPTQPKPVVGDFLKMQFVEYRVVPTILSFFFRYPWNNFLHNVVYDIVQQVFNGPMDRGYNPTLAVSLFEAADITNQIIKGQLASEKSQAESKTRMGYMGHLTLIAEEVVKFTERHPPELLSDVVLEKVMAPDWVSYVEGALAETRERDNAILGGVRPEVAMNRAGGQGLMGGNFSGLSSIGLSGGASSALADAGLSGGSDTTEGSGGGLGPFSISSGTLMSGFGSSSDEDDDEEQDTEEDVNSEFRAYTDPLNNNNSMDPPSIPPPPPPPPPLNVPPSRARLQLAARLAMNKKNSATASSSNGGQESTSPPAADDATGSGIFSLPNTSASERLRNPFADYEDDDDDNSGSESSDGEPETVEGEESLGLGAGKSTWQRGSWWRGVVGGSRSSRRRSSGSHDEGDDQEMEIERFGDGRDDDSSDEEGGRRLGDDDDIEDEEFGDFAMPEVEERAASNTKSSINPPRESIIYKPTAVHPTASTIKSSGISPFSSLWPFSREKKEGEEAAGTTAKSENANANTSVGGAQGNNGGGITEEPVDLTKEGGKVEETVVGEDGKKIDRCVEATRRTSIEDPDEDEVDVGEEIIVHRGAEVQ
ncbi:hypothetical protein VTH82DRAFT_7035 [Thermothelomyces myriococcoides]